jgi:hypothetical protein
MITTANVAPHPRFAQLIVGVAGALNLLIGIAMLVAPVWFYDTIGTFPPYNRHFLGDLGSFLLPLGAGLLVAARDPARHALLIGVVALGSLLHSLNHTYDALISQAPLAFWLSDTLPLLLLGVLMLLAYTSLPRKQGSGVRGPGSGFWTP